MHQVALLRAEVQDLRRANETLSKRRKAKRTRLHQGGSLTLQEGQDLIRQTGPPEYLQQDGEEDCIVVGGVQPR